MAKQTEKTEKPKKEKIAKTPFVTSQEAREAGIVNDDRKLLTHEFGEILDSKIHKAPKKGDFAEEHTYLRYRASQLEAAAEGAMQRARSLRGEADVIEKQPDPEKRSAIRRLARLRDQAAALEAELAAEGIAL